MYKIEKIPTRKRGFNREQLNIIALRLLEAVNECSADLELDKTPSQRRRGGKPLKISHMVNTECFDYPAEKDYEPIKIYIPMSNCVLNIHPTTEAINKVLKRLSIKFAEV